MKLAPALLFLPAAGMAGTVVLEPVKDTTLYEDVGGALGNGGGDFLFVGRTNQPPPLGVMAERGQLRRTLLEFAVAGAVPSGAEVVSAKLELTASKVPALAPETLVSVHRVLADWGEGTSDASQGEGAGIFPDLGDATWSERFYAEPGGALWNSPGGDFVGEVSGAAPVTGQDVRYSWETAEMSRDVAEWAAGSVPNFGWILVGDESTTLTAKRFNSRENPDSDSRPSLTIDYLFPTEVIDAALQQDGSIHVQFTTVSGQSYTPEAATNLEDWAPGATVAGDGSAMTVMVPAPPSGNRLFVRVAVSD